MKSKKFFNVKNIIAVLVIMAIVVGFYEYTAKKSDATQVSGKEYDVLVNKDLEYAYPETPGEVVKLYARMVKCMYSGDLSDKELKKLMEKQRLLLADSLLENNPLDEQLERLKEDVKDYEDDDKSIITYKVASSDDVTYSKESGKQYAVLQATFTVKAEKKYEKTFEEFTLCKDKIGWKITGWTLANDNDTKK